MNTQHAPRNTKHATRSIPCLPLLAITLLAFVLRLYRLDAQPIWWDEAISIHLANSSLLAILADRVTHVHPPLYFVLLKGWVGLAGDSVFGVRFFSAALNALLVPAVYAFARRWFDRRAGLWAALLVMSSPLYVIYSQETRVYAILPLLYLALLALLHRLTTPAPTVRHWLLFVLVQAVGLYLHYVFLLAVAYVNLRLLLCLWRRPYQRRCWILSLGATFLTCLPWAVAVLFNWSAVLTDVAGSDPFAEPIPFDHFVRLLWTFQWTGLTAALNDATLTALVALLALLLATVVVLLLVGAATRRPALTLLAHWLAPLAGALLMWQAKPLSHPRYVALFAVAALLLCGYGLARLFAGNVLRKGLAALLGLMLLCASAFSLRGYFFDPRYGKDNTRGAAEAIADRSLPGDLLLVPPEDWSVPYYYRGPARVEMVRSGDISRLATLTAAGQTVFLVDTNRATHDPGRYTAFALESAGSLTDRWDFKGLNVRVYRLGQAAAWPELSPADARFGPLRLTGAWLEPGAPSDTAVAVALRWQVLEPSSAPLRVGLRLLDPDGWAWATADDWLLDVRVHRTDRWSAGQVVTTCHILPLSPGAPPLSYTLSLGVYERDGDGLRPLELLDAAGNPQGQSFDLGEVALGAPIGVEGDPYRVGERAPLWATPVAVGDGITLAGAALDRLAAAPGQPVYVTLRWSAGELPDGRLLPAPVLTLEQGGVALVSAASPAGGRYPPERWAAGQTVVEHRRLVVPPTAADGPAVVALQVGAQRIELGMLTIAVGEHLFVPPPMGRELTVRFGDVAELLGYDLERTDVVLDQPVTITLYWRALEEASAADYTVFTHILATDGHLVGQHDSPPAGGGRPTPGWLPGEIIVDRHDMTFREVYSGTARIEVGLYDPASVVRVSTTGGETAVVLPDLLNVRLP